MPRARNKILRSPIVLDDETLAAIDKAERWRPGSNNGVTIEVALQNARKRYRAWKKAVKETK